MADYDGYNFRADLGDLRLSPKDAARALGTTERKVCDYANGAPLPAEIVTGVKRLVDEEYAFRRRTGMSSDGRRIIIAPQAVEGCPKCLGHPNACKCIAD